MKIAIIGVGRLGGMLAAKLAGKHEITAIDSSGENLGRLEFHGKKSADLADARRCDALIIAVKPMDVGTVLAQLKPLRQEQLLVSCAAGVPMAYLKKRTGHGRIARVMPNMNIMAGEGLVAYCCAGTQGTEVRKIFSDFALCMEMDEKHFDSLTSISGSGPAFIWYAAKAFGEIAKEEGIPGRDARKIIGQLLKGCGEMMLETDIPLEELIARVASPGGTTEQGLKHLDGHGVDEILEETLRRAIEKSKEIGKTLE